MPRLDPQTIQTIHLLQHGGRYVAPTDSGSGNVGRNTRQGQKGGRVATPESYFDFFIDNVPPPDEAKQLDPDIEKKIRMHPDVVAAHNKRTFTVSSMPWRLDPNPAAGDRAAAENIAKYVKEVFDGIPRFQHALEHMQYAVLVGGQGLEFTWHQEPSGVEKPVAFQPVHMSRFLFDRLGNMSLLNRENAVWGSYISTDPQAAIDPRNPANRFLPRGKFVYHVYRQGQGTWERPALEGYTYYGVGEDIALYYTVVFDIFCLKFRMKYLERYGIPPTVLRYPENRGIDARTVRIADSLRGESVILIPKLMGGNVDNKDSLYSVDQLPVPTGSYDHFEAFSDRYTKPRVDAILLGSSDENQKQDGKGGYSDHVSRHDAGPNIWFRRDAAGISDTLTTQLVPAVVLGRFPGTPSSYWPRFVLEPAEEKDRMQEAQIMGEVAKLVKVAAADYYDRVGIRKPEPNEETVGGPQAGGAPGQPGQPGQPPEPGKPAPQGVPPQPGHPVGPKTPKAPVPPAGVGAKQPIGGGMKPTIAGQ